MFGFGGDGGEGGWGVSVSAVDAGLSLMVPALWCH